MNKILSDLQLILWCITLLLVVGVFVAAGNTGEYDISDFQVMIADDTAGLRHYKRRDALDFQSFLDELKTKEIFVSAPVVNKTPVRSIENDEIKELIGSLRLVGVFGQEEKKAVIENVKAGSTVYAFEGDEIFESVRVAKITSSSVTLESGGQEYRLDL